MAYITYEKGDSVILLRKPSMHIIELRGLVKRCRESGNQQDANDYSNYADFLETLEVGDVLSVTDSNDADNPTNITVYSGTDLAISIATEDVVPANIGKWFSKI